MTLPTSADVVSFWSKVGPERWYKKDAALDADILSRFLPLYEAAANGQLTAWETDPEGSLALVITLDQFPRNMFRNDPRAFAADGAARGVADRALARSFDTLIDRALVAFLYVPFMHSEDMRDQERCIALCRTAKLSDTLKFAELHADVIRRFRRFPHRNTTLGRETTAQEQAFLAAGGFAG
jgi:uncharacterized protein (DUF924 family)